VFHGLFNDAISTSYVAQNPGALLGFHSFVAGCVTKCCEKSVIINHIFVHRSINPYYGRSRRSRPTKFSANFSAAFSESYKC
jgi:hypothetical protein